MTEQERFELKNMIFDGLSIVDKINGGYYTADEQDLENICKILNELHEENEELKKEYKQLQKYVYICPQLLSILYEENDMIREEKKKIIDIINSKITQLGIDWYGAEDNSKEENEANLQLNILEELRDEIKKIEFN